MLMNVRRLEQDICDSGMLPSFSCLLKCLKVLLCLLLKLPTRVLRAKTVQECPNPSNRPPERVLDMAGLALKAPWILFAEVVLEYGIANDHVAKEYLFISRWWWAASTDAHNQGELNARVAH
jgi:hypothetical protein